MEISVELVNVNLESLNGVAQRKNIMWTCLFNEMQCCKGDKFIFIKDEELEYHLSVMDDDGLSNTDIGLENGFIVMTSDKIGSRQSISVAVKENIKANSQYTPKQGFVIFEFDIQKHL